MKEIKLTIDGKEVPLTKEQLKALSVETRKNPFERVCKGKGYFYIGRFDDPCDFIEFDTIIDRNLSASGNYFNDKSFAEQVALHQLLYRKLLKFAYDYGCEDTQEWDESNAHWSIIYDTHYNTLIPYWQKIFKAQEVYFSTKESAERAIKEVIEPFMKEHPEFVW